MDLDVQGATVIAVLNEEGILPLVVAVQPLNFLVGCPILICLHHFRRLVKHSVGDSVVADTFGTGNALDMGGILVIGDAFVI